MFVHTSHRRRKQFHFVRGGGRGGGLVEAVYSSSSMGV